MKNTALTNIHEALGAKIVPFAGYNMPVQYEGINIEHDTVRNSVGVFDVSHMGEFLIDGDNALWCSASYVLKFLGSLLLPPHLWPKC